MIRFEKKAEPVQKADVQPSQKKTKDQTPELALEKPAAADKVGKGSAPAKAD
ncbi:MULTISPECIES: hypothetical protein [Pseudorhizobium]|jgi:hypothetical protein|uniref:hypothetical protein n=1 Tax=Pseudorhizobium TaxID=1903858 RepID=UPI000A8D927F|nr:MULTISPECIES: hypothetical protein [Pseudorhizobium]MBU1314098.1 hypothetical protein [Alphaproteobacteria bacterium]MDY6963421.1 hypothetical protein [Pseudomonadota bacterium]MBU1552450.1 hypothetical protein [Alphaproteobacteria bacterium]MBU2339519.1 hypothetical protein [Alphaproteobacteria bacterium]MBU2390231.1 hypothetical protein [Alphaproteobacteria bacterium]|tara:strand:+ start:320 stop:475 length:156 start_codon:yes stop_codon:yes gene_type:complete